jgi:hypothetical protein
MSPMHLLTKTLGLLALVLMLGGAIAACWGVALADPFLFLGAYGAIMLSAVLLMIDEYVATPIVRQQQGTEFNPWQ